MRIALSMPLSLDRLVPIAYGSSRPGPYHIYEYPPQALKYETYMGSQTFQSIVAKRYLLVQLVSTPLSRTVTFSKTLTIVVCNQESGVRTFPGPPMLLLGKSTTFHFCASPRLSSEMFP